MLNLSIALLATLQAVSVWNIVRISFGKDNRNHKIIGNDTLEVFYPKGIYTPSVQPQGGIGFFASPRDVFPLNHVLLEYSVFFNETFDPVLGGKLPGLFLSTGTKKKDMVGATGGKRTNVSSSIRMAWRTDTNDRKSIEAEVYAYLPESIGKKNGIYGDSLWRGQLQFEKGIWNNVSIRVKLNDYLKINGELEVSINNRTKMYTEGIFKTNSKVMITAILFQTCFGGGSVEYATPTDQWVYFRDMKISKM